MDKCKSYIYILEYPNGDRVTRKGIRGRLQDKLPFLLQQQNEFAYKWIDELKVLSIEEWNEMYPEFPLEKLQGHKWIAILFCSMRLIRYT